MATPTDPDVIALIFGSSDGSYVVCTTPEEVLAAADAVSAAGGTPVLFHRSGCGRPADVSYSGARVHARDIHGRVRF
jgi:hypothetical protein